MAVIAVSVEIMPGRDKVNGWIQSLPSTVTNALNGLFIEAAPTPNSTAKANIL